ncbi:MAG TPA: hypothetical protein VEL11_05750 [Candidatus Bathyarchaeia archaeon]|nr:hypothetical protein [Candidatus Bathyarchaeia archaeon]
MSKALWACSLCGEDFTRRSSAERHRYTVHQGNSLIVRFVDYLAARSSGIYAAPIDPPRLLKRARPEFGKTPNGDFVDANDVWYTNTNKNLSKLNPSYLQYLSNESSNEMTNIDETFINLQNLLQLKMIMNRYSNQQIPFFLTLMNNSNPLCSTGIFPYANSSRVRSDHFFDTMIRMIMLKDLL